MTIDIIDYTQTQLAALSTVQLQEVRAAQRKKNELRKKYDELLKAEKAREINRGIFISDIFSRKAIALEEEYTVQVENIREGLLFFLRYGGGSKEESDTQNVPYPVDYSLTEQERMQVLLEYYENTYTDATIRFNAFNEDTFARSYLGELYGAMWHYFQDLANA